jgi:predicted MPP superfamily phosphohydrolase
MLPTTKFFLAEITVLTIIAAVQLIGLREIVAILKRAFPRFKNYMLPAVIGIALFVHAPFAYGMVLYKKMSVTLSPEEWGAMWVICYSGCSSIFTIGIYSLLKRIPFPVFKNSFKNIFKSSDKSNLLKSPQLQPIPIEPQHQIAQRRNFLKTTAIATAGTLVSGSILKAAETDDLVIENVVLTIRNLAPQLEGLTIGMMSDIHSSPFMLRDEMEFFRKKLEGLKTDLIFLPGDFVNSHTREVYPLAEAFAGISAPLGVYGVTGNHDYFSREIEIVAKEVEQAGIKLIRNSNIELNVNGAKLHLLGIDDPHSSLIGEYIETGKSEEGIIESVFKNVPNDATKIMLCHKPYYFEGYAKLNVDLLLAGHTHGGQIVWKNFEDTNLSFAGIVSDYIAGIYPSRRNPRSKMYVGRGVGSVGVPFRINCPPEITRITLKKA